jgi:hypothetical protein
MAKKSMKGYGFLIQKYITCEGWFSLIYLYHVIILLHLKGDKPLNMPYYLLKYLSRMSKLSKIEKKC